MVVDVQTPQEKRELEAIRAKRKLHSIMNFESEPEDQESSDDEATRTTESGPRELGAVPSEKQTDEEPSKRNRVS